MPDWVWIPYAVVAVALVALVVYAAGCWEAEGDLIALYILLAVCWPLVVVLGMAVLPWVALYALGVRHRGRSEGERR